MPKEADFKAEAGANQRSAPQDSDLFLAGKVDATRVLMHTGLGYFNEEVDAQFAARRSTAEN